MATPYPNFLGRFLFTLCALALAGCGTVVDPGAERFASVTIKNHSTAEIRAATAKVFQEAEYWGGASGATMMVFEKEASGMDTFSREGLVATQAGSRSLERVKVEVVELASGSHRLQCQAFIVSDATDSFFVKENRLSNMRRGTYRSLLKKVAKQLK